MTDSALRGPATADRYSLPRTLFRKFVHWASHTFILSSKRTRRTRVGDVVLEVPPSVFHPGVFVTSGMFAAHLRRLDLRGKRAVEIGTGSGILALSAALAGADKVVALDINPNAVHAARINAATNGVADRVEARLSNLFSAVTPDERFDLIISSPPSFAGEPVDIADHAWVAGPGYCHLRDLFGSARRHLAAGGEMLLLLSSDTNIPLLRAWAQEAGFSWQQIEQKSILIEKFVIFRLHAGEPPQSPRYAEPQPAVAAGSGSGPSTL